MSSEHVNYHGKMKSAQSVVDGIRTPRRGKKRIQDALRLIAKHEYIIKQEGIKIAKYRKEIRLLKEKFPELASL